jgi:TraX protein
MQTTIPSHHRHARAPYAVDNTDWLKTAAIILVFIDHFGYFFMEDDRWWSVFGRLAAPTFFFLLGYAQTQAVPLHWIWLGIILTLLNSWNANWTWVTPNILLSFVFIRIVRPHVQTFLQRRGWVAFAILVSALLVMLPIAAKIVDYGSEGWLWALFGLCQREYVDGRSACGLDEAASSFDPRAHALAENTDPMRLLACLIAAIVYFAVVVLGVGVLSFELYLFLRGPSRIQPPEAIATVLRFIGRHTLEIYAIQLAGSELIVKLVPNLAP